MTWVAWSIPPLSLAAGWLLWTRLPAGIADDDDPLEAGFASLLGGVLLTGCVALLLAEIGFMRPPAVASALGAACLLLWFLPRRSPPATRVPRDDLAAIGLVAVLAVVTLAPASEEVLGGRDEGVYTNIAAWVAEHGTLRIRSEALASLAPEARPIFHRGVLVPGFYIGDAVRGEIQPQFLHLHPIYMALGLWLGGLTGALLVPPLYGLLTHLATFLVVRRLLGAWPAVAASLVLGVSLPQIWVLRTPFSEGAAQFAAAGTIWCLTRAAATSGTRWGVLGGLAMGAGFLIRIDAILLLIALLPALAVLHASTARPTGWATLAFVPLTFAFAGWGLLHGYEFTPPYMRFMDQYLGPLWTLAGVLLALYAASLLLRGRVRAFVDRAYRHGRWWWALAALLVVAGFVFGMWLRPQFGVWAYGGRRGFVDEAMVRVGWYFSSVGMVAACGGTLILLRRWLVERRIEWVPFLAVFLAVSFAYFWNPRVSADHPWAMRRFIPVILPGIAVAITAAAMWLWDVRRRWWPAARIAAVLLLAFVLAHEVRLTLPFWSFREKADAIDQLRDIAQQIPRGAVLLHTTGTETWVATPLAFVFGYDSLSVMRRPRSPSPEELPRIFEAQVTRWLKEGRPVFYLTSDEGNWIYLSPRLSWEVVDSFRFVINRAGLHRTGPPPGPGALTESFHLLRVGAAPDQTPPCAGLTFDATEPAFGRTQGFHGIEPSPDGRFRWTYPESRVLFPSCDRRGAGRPSAVRVRARCSRAGADAPCPIAVSVNGVPAGSLPVTRAWQDHELAIPSSAVGEAHGPLDVRFSGPSFRPGRSGRIRDRRVLSFQMRKVTIANEPPQPQQGGGPVNFGVRSAP